MDDFDMGNFGEEELVKPIPFDNDDSNKVGVSHSPLNLGNSGPAEAKPQKIEMPKMVEKKTEKIVSSERITGVRTFYTKLHPGAMDFLDQQITKWLRENPGITIKRTNITTGEVQAKKTEHNIIITVWY